MQCHASYEIVFSETTPPVLTIRDLGPWCEVPTITNDAQHVVRELHQKGFLKAGRKLHYYDSDGRLDELLHDGAGRFMGFCAIVQQVKPTPGCGYAGDADNEFDAGQQAWERRRG